MISGGTRDARSDDVPALAEMLAELFRIETDFIPDVGAHVCGLSLILHDPSYRVIVATGSDDHPVGMITLHVLVSTALGGRVGLVEDLYVRPRWRRRGIGRSLCEAVERVAREKRLLRLSLLADNANLPALSFYDRIGWKRTSLVALHYVAQ